MSQYNVKCPRCERGAISVRLGGVEVITITIAACDDCDADDFTDAEQEQISLLAQQARWEDDE